MDVPLLIKILVSSVVVGLMFVLAKHRKNRIEEEKAEAKRIEEEVLSQGPPQNKKCEGCLNEVCICGGIHEDK